MFTGCQFAQCSALNEINPWVTCIYIFLFCVSLYLVFSLQRGWKIFVKWDFSIFLKEEKTGEKFLDPLQG